MALTSVQGSVTQVPGGGTSGGQADGDDEAVIESRIATTAIPFGVAVVLDVGGKTCRVPADVDDTANLAIALGAPDSTGAYAVGDVVRCLRFGRAHVRVEEAVVAGEVAYVRHTASGGNTQKGAFRNDADSGSCTDVSFTFVTDGSAASPPIISIARTE